MPARLSFFSLFLNRNQAVYGLPQDFSFLYAGKIQLFCKRQRFLIYSFPLLLRDGLGYQQADTYSHFFTSSLPGIASFRIGMKNAPNHTAMW